MGYFDKYNKQREQGTYQAPQQNATRQDIEAAIQKSDPVGYANWKQQEAINMWNSYVLGQQRREQEAQERALTHGRGNRSYLREDYGTDSYTEGMQTVKRRQRQQEWQKANADYESALQEYNKAAEATRRVSAVAGPVSPEKQKEIDAARSTEQRLKGRMDALKASADALQVNDSGFTDWEGRDALVKEYNKLQMELEHQSRRSPERLARFDEVKRQLQEGDRAAGNGAADYSFRDRSESIFGGTAKRVAGGLANTALTAVDLAVKYNPYLDAVRAVNNRFGTVSANPMQYRQGMDKLYAAADRISSSATMDLERAKNGLGKLGQAGVDIAENVLEMGFDAAVGALTGGGSLASMFARVFGDSAREARQQGATLEQQVGYGIAAGGIEVVTEKLSDFTAGIYGKGAADKISETVIRRLSSSPTGQNLLRVLLGFNSEGMEEVLSDLLQPFAQKIYKDESLGQLFREIDPAEVLYDYLIGGAVGGTFTALNTIGGGSRAKNAENNYITALYEQSGERPGFGREVRDRAILERQWTNPDAYNAANLSTEENAQEAMRALRGRQTETARAQELQQTQREMTRQNAESMVPMFFSSSGITLDDNQRGRLMGTLNDNDISAKNFAIGTRDAYNMGEQGATMEETVQAMGEKYGLSPKQARTAWSFGASNAQTTATGTADVSTEEGRTKVEAALSFLGDRKDDAVKLYDGKQDVGRMATAMNKAVLYAAHGADVQQAVQNAREGKAADVVGVLTDEQAQLAQEIGAERRARQQAADKALGESYRDMRQKAAAITGTARVSVQALEAVDTAIDATRKAGQRVMNEFNELYNALEALDKADPNAKQSVVYKEMLERAYKLRDKAQAAQKQIRELEKRKAQIEGRKTIQRKKGTVSFAGGTIEGVKYDGVDTAKLSRQQQKVVAMVERLADAVNLDYVFISADPGMGGAYTFGGRVYININAGLGVGDFSQTMAAASLSHEMTHWMQQYAPEEYSQLKDFIVQEILKADPQKLQTLIQQQKEWEKGRALTDEQALDEVVANACQTMLMDSKAINKLARQNMSLAARIADWIADWSQKVKDAFAEVDTSQGAIYEAVRALDGSLDRIQELWDNGIEAAVENYQGATGEALFDQPGKPADLPKRPSQVQVKSKSNPSQVQEQQKRAGMDFFRDVEEGIEAAAQNYDAQQTTHEANVAQKATNENAAQNIGDVQNQFIGESAETADKEALARAREMDKQGVGNESIRQQTGWFKGMDGKWRYEIPGNEMQWSDRWNPEKLGRRAMYVLKEQTELGELIKAPKLFEAYPELKNIRVNFVDDMPQGAVGEYNVEENRMLLRLEYAVDHPDKMLDTLAHEIQHAIQHIEGFTPGASPEYWANEIKHRASQTASVEERSERNRVNQEYNQIRKDNPEFFDEASQLYRDTPDEPLRSFDPVKKERIAPSPAWQEWQKRRDNLAKKWGRKAVDDFMILSNKVIQFETPQTSRSPVDLYYNTAGEIEARDAAFRRNFVNDSQYKGIKPNPGDENTVFAEGAQFQQWSDEEYEELTGSLDEDQLYTAIAERKSEENQLREQIKEMKPKEKEWVDKVSAKEATLDDFKEWTEASGYKAMLDRKDQLEKEIRMLYDRWEKARDNRLDREEKEALEKSGLSETEYFGKQAVKVFGYTPYYYDAGYIAPNGKMLNFSGEKGKHRGSRGQDHRAIGQIFATTQNSAAMTRFMNYGNIRIMGESPGIDISSKAEPTAEQYRQIKAFARNVADEEYFSVDLSDERGNNLGTLEYEGTIRPDRIINDIKHYYQTGEIRDAGLSAFYQRWDNTDGDTAAEANGREEAYTRLQSENKAVEDTIAALRKLTEKQGSTIERLQKRLRLTTTPEVREADARKLARNLVKEYGSRADVSGISEQLKALGDYVAQTKDLNADEVKNRAREIARGIVESASEQVSFEDETIANIRGSIKGKKLTISPDFIGELDQDDGFDAFRKRNFGAFTLARADSTSIDRSEYTSVSQFYTDLQSEYGKAYFPDLANEGEEIRTIAEFARAAAPMEVNPFEQYMGEATEELANRISMEVMDGALRLTPATDADKAKTRREALQDRIRELQREGKVSEREAKDYERTIQELTDTLDKSQSRYRTLQVTAEQRMAQVRAEGRARQTEIKAKEREKAAENIKALKDHFRDMSRKARERRTNTATRRSIRKLIADLNNRLKHPTENKHVPRELMQATLDVLNMIDLDTGRGGTQAAQKLADIRALYESYKTNPTYQIAYDETTADMLDQLALTVRGTRLADMSELQLKAVHDTLKSLIHVIDTAVRIKIGTEEYNAYELSREMTMETRAVPKAQRGWLREHLIPAHLRADVAFRRFGGFKKNSKWEQAAKLLNDGQLKETRLKMELSRPFAEIFNDEKALADFTGVNVLGKVDTKKLVDIGLKDANGEAILVNHDFMVGIYMDLLNEDNRRHFINGGKTIPNIADFYSGNGGWGAGAQRTAGIAERLSELNRQLSEAERTNYGEWADDLKEQIAALKSEGEQYADDVQAAIESKLTDYDREWIAACKQLMDVDSKRELNRTTMDVYGIEKASVPNYWPITSDSDFLSKPMETVTKDMSLENVGFMKDRIKGANPSLALGTVNVVTRQIDRVSHYCGMMPALRSFGKIWNKTEAGYADSIKKATREVFQDSGVKYVENLIADLTGGRTIDRDILGLDAALGKLRGNLAQTSLTINPRVAMAQAASYPTAAAELGWGPLAKALARGGKNGQIISRADTDLIAKWSPLLYHRMQGYSSPELGDIQSSTSASSKLWRKARWITGWIQAVDGATVGRLWYAAEYWVQDNKPTLQKGSDAYYEAVAEKFNAVVEKTQPNYTPMQRAAILREPSNLVKTFTMFMTQRLQNYNILYDAAGSYQKARADFANGRNGVTQADVSEARQNVARAVTSQLAQAAVYVGFKVLADALLHNMKKYRDKDTGDFTAESVSKAILDAYLEAWMGIEIFGSELYSIIKAVTGVSKWYGLSVSGVDSVNDLIENVVKLAQNDWTTDSGKENGRKTLLKVGTSLAQAFGIPLQNGIKLGEAVFNHITDAVNGEFFSFDAGYERTKKQEKAKEAVDAGVPKSVYLDTISEANTNGGTLAMDELGTYLHEAIPAGKLTEEQADIIWNVQGWSTDRAGWNAKAEKAAAKAQAITDLISPLGISQDEYDKIIDEANADGSSLTQDELGTYLTEAIGSGKLTEEQANAIWKTRWNSAGSKTFDKWRGVQTESNTKQETQTQTAASPKPTQKASLSDFESFKKSVSLYSDKKEAAYRGWENEVKPLGVSLDSYVKIINAADAAGDGNGSVKQDEMGMQLVQKINRRELTYEQAEAIWHTIWNGARSKTFYKWYNG